MWGWLLFFLFIYIQLPHLLWFYKLLISIWKLKLNEFFNNIFFYLFNFVPFISGQHFFRLFINLVLFFNSPLYKGGCVSVWSMRINSHQSFRRGRTSLSSVSALRVCVCISPSMSTLYNRYNNPERCNLPGMRGGLRVNLQLLEIHVWIWSIHLVYFSHAHRCINYKGLSRSTFTSTTPTPNTLWLWLIASGRAPCKWPVQNVRVAATRLLAK